MAWLACLSGDDRGLIHELADGKSLVMGRQEGCDIRLVHAGVSRRHCQVTLKQDLLLVEDLGSSNGIKQQGRRIRGKSLKLKGSETFDIAGDRFEFAADYEQYVTISDRLKSDLQVQNPEEMQANYSKLINEVARTRKFKQPEKSFFRRLFGG